MKCVPAGLSLAALLFAFAAAANGRFPRAQRLIESTDDHKVLALYGTYGLLVTTDAGTSWSHICEAATGPYAGEDPLLELFAGARILARTETALVTSTDTWCNWKTALDGTTNSIQDITRDPTVSGKVLALLGAFDAQAGFGALLSLSTDAGTSWSPPKALPRDQIARGLSLEVPPSLAKRVVVTGLDSGGKGKLLVSDDAGVSWQGRALATTDSNAAPYLAAISKTDANRIFVRTDAYQDVNGIDTASDALLLSVDGGASWVTLIERQAKLFGFALSPDESTLLVGYGDPVLSATAVEPGDLGIYRANLATILADPLNASTQFLKIFDGSVTCLRWTPTALYACTSQNERGFEVGRAPNAAFALSNAQPFTPLLVLSKLKPLACGPGTDGYACYTDPDNGFPSVCRTLQASCDASAPPPVVSSDGSVVNPGTGGAASSSIGGSATGLRDGGASLPAAGGGARGTDRGMSLAASHGDSAACACRTAPARPVNRFGLTAGLAIALLRRARRFGARRPSNTR